MTKKLYKLKQWYSLQDAAERLSLTLGENVSIQDVIQLAIEGHIKISWYMRHVTAQEVVYDTREITIAGWINDEPEQKILCENFYSKENEYVDVLDGPHHLLLENCAALSDYLLAHITKTGGELLTLDGYFVQGENNKIWRIVEQFEHKYLDQMGWNKNPNIYCAKKYFPSAKWPEISELGFTKDDIELFEKSLQSKSKELNELDLRERNTVLKIIIGMAIKGYSFNPNKKRNPTAKEITSDISLLGLSIDEDTVRRWLKEACEKLPDNWDPEK